MKPPQRIRYIVLACQISPNANEDQIKTVVGMFNNATCRATLLREGSAVYEVTRDANVEQINNHPSEVPLVGLVYHAEDGIPCEHDIALAKDRQ